MSTKTISRLEKGGSVSIETKYRVVKALNLIENRLRDYTLEYVFPGDSEGLDRELRIRRSKIREVYTPHRPIKDRDLFCGRHTEVNSIVAQLDTPGQHSLLFGERGVGKSSLAKIASDIVFSRLLHGTIFYEWCDSTTTFEHLLREPLADRSIDTTITETTSSRKSSGSGKLKLAIAEGGTVGF